MRIHEAMRIDFFPTPPFVPGGVAGDELSRARALLDDIEQERDRILFESQELGFFAGGISGALDLGTGGFDPLHFRDVAASNLSLLEQIDRFAGETFDRLERKAVGPPPDDAMAARLLRATQDILALLRGVSPIDDVASNVRDTAKGAASDLDRILKQFEELLTKLTWAMGIGLAGYVAVMVLPLILPRRA